MGMGVEFVVCRTVRDCAAMLDAVSKPMPGDSFVIRQPDRPYLQEVGAPVEPLRIARTTACNLPGMATHPEVATAVEYVVTFLQTQGHQVEQAQPIFEYEEYLKAISIGWIYGFDGLLEGLPLYNLTGQPAISLPLAQTTDDLPIGIQFVAHFGREDVLLRLAAMLEAPRQWRDRTPAFVSLKN